MSYNIKNHIEVIAPMVYTHHYGLIEYSIFILTIGAILIQFALLIREIKLWRENNER
jgi:hypothetical protein